MKKYYFVIILLCFINILKADSIDNQLINDLQESKKDSKKSKKVSKTEIEEVIIESKEETKADFAIDSKDNAKNDQKDLEKQIEILEAKLDSKKKEKPLKWFIGAYIGTRYNATFNGVGAQNFDLGAQGGIYYYVAKNHGARVYATLAYSSLSNKQVFLIGAGADYFYSFQSGFRIFGGVSANLPLNNNVLSKNDVILYGGVGGFMAKSHYIELKIGYPLMQDTRLSKSAVIVVGYQYIF